MIPHPPKATARSIIRPRDQGLALPALIAFLIVGWFVGVLTLDSFKFVIFNPRGSTGFEIFVALGQLFGALVLWLSSLNPVRNSLRWIAMALLVLGIGALQFGYLVPLFFPDSGPNLSLYGSVLTRGVASILLAIGLMQVRPPGVSRFTIVALGASFAVVSTILLGLGDRLPELIHTSTWDDLISGGNGRFFPGLSSWYVFLSVIPLLLSIAAVWGAVRFRDEHALSDWIIPGTIMFAGAQLHALLWPSMYSSILTTTSVLRFGWTAIVIAGAITELYILSRERSLLLAKEQDRVRQLEELSALKRDFTAIVAHELGTPLAAIGNLAHMIKSGLLPEAQQRTAAERIQGEARLLQLLVRDFQESADVERDDFKVRPQRVRVQDLLDDANAYAQAVRHEHPCSLVVTADGYVSADRDRIGQVIRNLLNNAVRHTPSGTPIRIEAHREATGIRISVIDNGPGIDPNERARILEKFGRGANAGAEGRGLGLYLTRRILQTHGSDLDIESEPGKGARFSFHLEEAP